MSARKQQVRKGRFVSTEEDFALHRAPGKRALKGHKLRSPLGLSTLRRERKLSQVELADRLGVDQARISRVERRSDVKLSTFLDYLQGVGADKVEFEVTFEDGSQAKLPLG